ncbi:helix-turn-helix domain containing protein [Streptomyces sp. WMMC500]|uniref:TetR/AcrR family transcriptional regulator n=1 Tax=Streptomyces sp. WMMC500 TaxID=3015154 RepID=UPI00248BE01B|nr:TetR/AcrR family transcriptional regulator [Streptomyces sp. WMMC500]WBB62851.1 helix-turn-helix domain containing protein [Streptomyces sp. WMMC500]
MRTPMRADARRNRELILRAAGEVFVGEGPDAPLEEVARRAGVGIATLYRNFASREALIRGVAVATLASLRSVAGQALAAEDEPFEALRRFAHAALDLRIGAVLPALSGRIRIDEELAELRALTLRPVQELIVRAQRAGQLRDDVVFGDVPFMVMRLTLQLPGGGLPEGEALAHRHLELYLDGLRPEAARARGAALPGPVLTAAHFIRATDRIVGGTDRRRP